MRPYRRQLMVLLPLLGVVALVAQIAGVGTTEQSNPKIPKAKTLAIVPGGSVPDITSTTLGSASVKAGEGDVVRMRATAKVRVAKLASKQVAQVVCGIRYSRDGDASWTLGTPYETVQLTKKHPSETVSISRTFDAPAKDRYRARVACHVSAPQSRVKVTATGSVTTKIGLPDGAAVPVA